MPLPGPPASCGRGLNLGEDLLEILILCCAALLNRPRVLFHVDACALEDVQCAEVPGADVLSVANVQVDNLNEEARLSLDVGNQLPQGAARRSLY